MRVHGRLTLHVVGRGAVHSPHEVVVWAGAIRHLHLLQPLLVLDHSMLLGQR
jgi:hypothetical protein